MGTAIAIERARNVYLMNINATGTLGDNDFQPPREQDPIRSIDIT